MRRVARIGVLLGVSLVLWQWAVPPFYHVSPPQPFRGSRWDNPYQDFPAERLRGNFHAHARATMGLTYGTASAAGLRAAYRELGYDLPCVSNYMNIAPSDGEPYLSAYEHGFGVGQEHQGVLGAQGVLWWDYLWFQGLRQKQHVLDLLARDGAFVILNHPDKGGGYGDSDLRQLTGYDAIEIRSRFSKRVEPWDVALGAGRRVWAVCTDDSHDPSREQQLRKGWVMIGAAPQGDAILAALKAGRYYSVWSPWRTEPPVLKSCQLEGDVLHVVTETVPDFIRFIGPGGVKHGEHWKEIEARYRLQPEDSYIRVEIQHGGNVLYLNPLCRHDGGAVGAAPARVHAATCWVRAGGGVLWLLCAGWCLRRRRAS